MTRRTERAGFVAFAVVLFALIVGANYGCREWRIDRCEDRGGQAVVPPLFTHDPTAVSCINP